LYYKVPKMGHLGTWECKGNDQGYAKGKLYKDALCTQECAKCVGDEVCQRETI